MPDFCIRRLELAVDESDGSMWLDGPDADRLFEVVKPRLPAAPISHNVVATLRYGDVNVPQAACSRRRDVSFEDLSEVDRVLISIWQLEADVNNGGFDQYYFNTSSDTARYAPTALRAIGARVMADIVQKANAIFGPSGPPISRDERQAMLLALTDGTEPWKDLDRQFCAYPEDISALLRQFLETRMPSQR